MRERPAGGWQKLWTWLADPKWTSLEVVKVAVSVSIPVSVLLVGQQFETRQKAAEASLAADEAAAKASLTKEEAVERRQNRRDDIDKSLRDAAYAELTAYSDVIVDLQAKSAALVEAHRALERLEQEGGTKGMDTARVDRAEARLDEALDAFDTAANLADIRLFRVFRKVEAGPVPQTVSNALMVAHNSAVELGSCGLAHRSRLRGEGGTEAESCEDFVGRIMRCTNVVTNYSTEAIEMLRQTPLDKVTVEVDPKMQACRAG